MKSLSAAIVLLSGAMILVGGSFVAHDQTQGVLQLMGSAIGAIGLGAWIIAFRQPTE